jgi:hypothetical protein
MRPNQQEHLPRPHPQQAKVPTEPFFIAKAQMGTTNILPASARPPPHVIPTWAAPDYEFRPSVLYGPPEEEPATINGYYSIKDHNYKDDNFRDNRPAYINGPRRYAEPEQGDGSMKLDKGKGKEKEKVQVVPPIEGFPASPEGYPPMKWEHVEKWNWICCRSRDLMHQNHRHKILISKSIWDCPTCGHEICHNCHKPLVYLIEPERAPHPGSVKNSSRAQINSGIVEVDTGKFSELAEGMQNLLSTRRSG